MNTILRNVPTRLRDQDLLSFAPLKVVTVADIRNARVKNLKRLRHFAIVGAGCYVLVRALMEAKEEYDELAAIAAGER
jgi:hypothetical protein